MLGTYLARSSTSKYCCFVCLYTGAVRKNHVSKQATDVDIDKHIMKWFHLGSDINRRGNRQSRAQVTHWKQLMFKWVFSTRAATIFFLLKPRFKGLRFWNSLYLPELRFIPTPTAHIQMLNWMGRERKREEGQRSDKLKLDPQLWETVTRWSVMQRSPWWKIRPTNIHIDVHHLQGWHSGRYALQPAHL